MKKHYETHVEDTDKLISVAGPILEYKSWYEQYRKLMEEQAQRKYGLYTPTSEGDEDDFPSIPGMIARYSASGLTNEQMKENPVWVDKTGNGHGLQMKNLAWGGMSGVGGYEMNFNSWTNNVPSISDISMSKTTSSVSVSVGNSAYNNNLIYIHKNNWDVNKNHWLKVASTYEDGDLAFVFYNDKNTKKIELPANGYVNIPAYPEFKGSYIYISTTSNKQGSFTIEQLPLYPGALVFDGVDDYGVCDNFPILTKEKGYTVVALRQWDQDFLNTTLTGGLLSTRNYSTGEGVAFEKIESSDKGYWNLGAGGIIDFAKSPFTWQTSKQYNNVGILKGDKNHGKPLCVGCGLSGGQQCGRFAIWELVFLDHDATEEELTKIKDYFVKTYPWLFPDQAWTVVGKTNEDEDRATIANITGNGNDLVLSNFGFAEGSGYNEEGEYAGYLVTDGVDDKIISSIFKMGNDFTVVGEWVLLQNLNVSSLRKDGSFIIRNHDLGLSVAISSTLSYARVYDKSLKAFCSNGMIYKSDWTEQIDTSPRDSTGGDSQLWIASRSNGLEYDKIAFKNLAIYPTVLSKEDCIKAYNYLQTLKAK
jgi:hypothetical protein